MTSRSPHVIMVTNAVAPDKLGGLERYVRELSHHLVQTGAMVTVVTKRTDTAQPSFELGSDGVRIRRYSPPSKSDPTFAVRYPVDIVRGVRAQIARAVGDGGARRVLLHGHFPVPMLDAALRRTPYAYTCHAPVHRELLSERRGSYALPRPLQAPAVRGLRAAERRVVRSASTVITLSEFVRSEVSALDAQTGARVTCIPGGLDTDWFRPDDDPARRPHDGDDFVLFTARRLVERTGVDRLVEAMPSILSQVPHARLDIAGSGPLGAVITERVQELALGDRVRLLGRISDEELRERYRRADIAITPTVALEGFGLSTAEALACGTIAVATPVGANAEVLAGLSPRLVTRGAAPQHLAETIVELAHDPDLAIVRSRARAHVHPRWAWPSVVDAHLALYDELPALA